MAEYKEGSYYWVKEKPSELDEDPWGVGFYAGDGAWLLSGSDEVYHEADFQEIGPEITRGSGTKI